MANGLFASPVDIFRERRLREEANALQSLQAPQASQRRAAALGILAKSLFGGDPDAADKAGVEDIRQLDAGQAGISPTASTELGGSYSPKVLRQQAAATQGLREGALGGLSPDIKQAVQTQDILKRSGGSPEGLWRAGQGFVATGRVEEGIALMKQAQALQKGLGDGSGKRDALAALYANPTDLNLRQSAAKAGASPTEINDVTKSQLSAKSTAGKEATDLGFTAGTPEFQAEVARRLAEKGDGVTVVNQMGTVPSPFAEQLGKEAAKAFSAQGEDARTASISLNALNESANLLNSGKIITGAAGDFRLAFTKALALGGFIGTENIEATEAFFANQGRQVAQVIKAFGSGTGLSDKDREYAEKIAGGQIGLDETSLRRLVSLGQKYSTEGINQYNKRVENIVEGNPEFKDVIPLIDLPEAVSVQELKNLPTDPNLTATNPETGQRLFNIGGVWQDRYGNKQ